MTLESFSPPFPHINIANKIKMQCSPPSTVPKTVYHEYLSSCLHFLRILDGGNLIYFGFISAMLENKNPESTRARFGHGQVY